MRGDIFIYGGIGTDRGEISFENVNQQIKENKDADELVVHIISPGGDVFEGEAIYNALKNTNKKLTGHIEGTCASIATLIIGACDKIIMNKTGRFMIHNPKISGLQQAADSRELRHIANQLDKIKGLFMNVWDAQTARRNKPITSERLSELYDNETWMTADEAEQEGFIDESVDAIKAVAKVDLTKFKNDMKDTSKFDRLMRWFENKLKFTNEATETLADGTIIVIMTEDGDFTGKQVMYESGEPVPAGDHTLASGRVIVVDGNSVITEVREAEVANSQDMEKDKEIENLKAQLAEAQAKATEAEARATTAKAETVKFQNKINGLEKDFLALKEEALKTIGDTTPPAKATKFKNKATEVEDYDPMGEEAMKFYKNRNLIGNEKE